MGNLTGKPLALLGLLAVFGCDANECDPQSENWPVCDGNVFTYCPDISTASQYEEPPPSHWVRTNCSDAAAGAVCIPNPLGYDVPMCGPPQVSSYADDPGYDWAQWPVPPDVPTGIYTIENGAIALDAVTGLQWSLKMGPEARGDCKLLLNGLVAVPWRAPTGIETESIWGSPIQGAQCVLRQPIPTGDRYTLTTDTVRDNRTTLTWQRNINTQLMAVSDASSYCASLDLGGFSLGWRLPRYKELETLVIEGDTSNLVAEPFASAPADACYWATNSHDVDANSVCLAMAPIVSVATDGGWIYLNHALCVHP